MKSLSIHLAWDGHYIDNQNPFEAVPCYAHSSIKLAVIALIYVLAISIVWGPTP